ncbi:MAG: hypothetical protein AAF958_01380 [Planctomycetota bacterium]
MNQATQQPARITAAEQSRIEAKRANYRADVASDWCRGCEKRKQRGKPLCARCYYSLPFQIRQRIASDDCGDGFELFQEAVELMTADEAIA